MTDIDTLIKEWRHLLDSSPQDVLMITIDRIQLEKLIAEIEKLKTKLEKAKEALQFYAEDHHL